MSVTEPGEVVNLDVARLEGRDSAKLRDVIRLLEELRLDDGKPLTLNRKDGRWILLFGRIEGTQG